MESCLNEITNRALRVSFTKMRIRNHRVVTETGR